MCDFCKHYFYDKENKKLCCDAFPCGIPLDKMPMSEVDIPEECNNGIRYEEE